MSNNLARNRSSQRERAAHTRKAYTNESFEAALAGLGRKNDPGLDSCLPGQRAFRALFALGLFNEGLPAAPQAQWGYSVLSAYDPVMSPRWRELVVIAERAPDNVTQWLLPDSNRERLPGLRLEGCNEDAGRTYVMRHEPTGARLVVTSRASGRTDRNVVDRTRWRESLMVGEELTSAERRKLDSIPPMTPEAEVLLAGLVTRFTLVDPGREWATDWSADPLRRGGSRRTDPNGLVRGNQRRLWGDGNSWELRWSGFPYPQDLGIALTHPVIGIPGAELHAHRSTYEVTLGDAVLELRDWRT
ncbi:hypothetical protein [Kitasatospora sp. NPDC094015]|uniref:hypothetical protein n=1 Tax=Kitasatospora sp. NPDC094015 TaxID=3155205 RepID=UPI00332C6904